MTTATNQNDQIAAAAGSVLAKLEGLRAEMSDVERYVLGAAFWQLATTERSETDDVAGYKGGRDAALNSVANLPIWTPLQQAVAELTKPINWHGFDK